MPWVGFEPTTSDLLESTSRRRFLYSACRRCNMNYLLLHSPTDSKSALIRARVSDIKAEDICYEAFAKYNFSEDSRSGWLKGRYPTPLVVLRPSANARIQSLCIRGAASEITPPLIGPKLAYLTGVVLGDGHVKNYLRTSGYPHYAIIIEKRKTEYSAKFLPALISSIFGPAPKIYFHRRKSDLVRISIASKIIHRIFTNLLGFSAGKKSGEPVKHAKLWPDELKREFIAGLFDTDGGRSGNSYSLGSTSKQIIDFARDFLHGHGVRTKTYTQHFPTSDYWHLYVLQKDKMKFLDVIPVKNSSKFP